MSDAFSTLARPGVDRLRVYEPGRPIDEVARELGFADVDEIVKLASNENALGPSPLAVAAMRAAAGDMHRYPDGGAFHLKRALAGRLDVTPEMILPGNGSNELIELLANVFMGPGRSIVVADRAFVVYRLIAACFNTEVIAVPMQTYTHDLEAMVHAVRDDTRLIFVSNPNNPTSTMVETAAIERFMDRVPGHAIVCFDEAYIELLPPERRPDVLRFVREGRPVVVLRTFSKAYGLAGLRLGYAVAPEACINLLNRVRQPFNVNAMAQQAALAALEDEAHVERTRHLVSDGIRQLTEGLDAMGVAYVPPCANFMLVEVGGGRDAFAALQRAGVIVRPMDGYGLPEHVRVTVGTAAENERFLSALAALRTAVGEPA